MTPTTLTVLSTLAAYLMGSLSFSVLVSKSMGLADPRSYGSGNPGATNVLRSGSKKAAIATLVLDAAKGWLPVFLVRVFGPAHGLDDIAVALAGLAAFLGHLFPVFFRYSALASLVAAVFAPFFAVLGGGIAWPRSIPITAAIAVMALLLVWRHRLNIQRLLAGKESRLGRKR